MNQDFVRQLVDAAAAPYLPSRSFAWRFARGKLAGDPVFLSLLERGLLTDRPRILDLGCGQGLLAAWLFAAGILFESGHWPAHWPAPPRLLSFRGIDLMADDIRRASRLHGGGIEFVQGDIRQAEFGEVDAVVLFDVLHYLDFASQADLLARIRSALTPEGVLLMRIGDAHGDLRFGISNVVDHVVTFVRGHRLSRFHCRALRDWQALLKGLGFAVKSIPMSRGTPFANVLLVASLSF